MTDPKTQIDRINEISAIARTSWLALLGYLAFIGISLLAVEDADFFVPTRRTDLPLVGVAIPTYSFFFFAPILAAALYIYLQVHLLKLWDAIADAPATVDGRPLGEHLHPWIANDYALHLKGNGALRPRPLRWLGNLATRLLVWIAGPAVIAGFWWRSMPAHDEWLTLTIAAALLFTLYVGMTSWWTARTRLRTPWSHAGPWDPRWRRPAGIALALAVVSISWLRTEAGFDHYANRLIDLADAAFGTEFLKDCRPYTEILRTPVPGESPDDCFFANGDPKPLAEVQHDRVAALRWLPALDTFTLRHDSWLAGLWLDSFGAWTRLARTDLEGVELVDMPDVWRTPETARAAFRKTWCEREGLSMDVCDHPPSPDRPPPATRAAARKKWCGSDGTDTAACLSQLQDLESRFDSAWNEERAATLANLPRLSLAGRDLRNAYAPQASLVHADLRGTRLEETDLRGARLESADLSGARLEGANLDGARLEGANLGGARLQWAHLVEARLDRASLSGSSLDWATLSRTRLEGANLSRVRGESVTLTDARMVGADLDEARLSGAEMSGVQLQGASLEKAELDGANLTSARMEGADLDDAQLKGADLNEARLQGASLRRARLEGAEFREAWLDGGDLREARLAEADFRTARLTDADLRGARLRDGMFQGADLSGARLMGADLRGADLSEARLERTDLNWLRLEGASLSGANLAGANLSGAWLEGADLTVAWLEGADLRNAKLGGADFSGASAQFADLRGARGLMQSQLDQMIGSVQTLLSNDGDLTIPSCWKTLPVGFDALVERVALREPRSPDDVRAEFLCPEGEEPQRTGTRLPLDAPYPDGHPLADRR